jgi:hypothetical protein
MNITQLNFAVEDTPHVDLCISPDLPDLLQYHYPVSLDQVAENIQSDPYLKKLTNAFHPGKKGGYKYAPALEMPYITPNQPKYDPVKRYFPEQWVYVPLVIVGRMWTRAKAIRWEEAIFDAMRPTLSFITPENNINLLLKTKLKKVEFPYMVISQIEDCRSMFERYLYREFSSPESVYFGHFKQPINEAPRVFDAGYCPLFFDKDCMYDPSN